MKLRPEHPPLLVLCIGLAAFSGALALMLWAIGNPRFPAWAAAALFGASVVAMPFTLWKRAPKKEEEKPDEDRLPVFSDETRFRHTFVVAPTGAGKTNLLQHFLKRDFDRVKKGECSVIIMDATGDLLNEVTYLDRFAGEKTPLVLADVGDTKFPLALSLFDFGLSRVSEENRDEVRAQARELLDYLFSSLLNVEMTGLQMPSLAFALEVLIERPQTNLTDLKAFLQPGGWMAYSDIISRLRPEVGQYFEASLNDKEVQKRNAEVVRRIDTLIANPILSNICNARETRLDFFDAMNRPSVIFINLNRKLLQGSLETVGRYFLARILLAAQRRIDIKPDHKRFPCFLYMDECQHIIKRDEKISVFMDDVRKYRVGGTFLTQRVGEFEQRPLDAILGNVATIFATDLRDGTDARFARFMGTTAQFISEQPARHFALRSEKHRRAISVPVTRATLFDEPKMSKAEHDELRALMRQRYARSIAPPPAPAPEPTPEPEPVARPEPPPPDPAREAVEAWREKVQQSTPRRSRKKRYE